MMEPARLGCPLWVDAPRPEEGEAVERDLEIVGAEDGGEGVAQRWDAADVPAGLAVGEAELLHTGGDQAQAAVPLDPAAACVGRVRVASAAAGPAVRVVTVDAAVEALEGVPDQGERVVDLLRLQHVPEHHLRATPSSSEGGRGKGLRVGLGNEGAAHEALGRQVVAGRGALGDREARHSHIELQRRQSFGPPLGPAGRSGRRRGVGVVVGGGGGRELAEDCGEAARRFASSARRWPRRRGAGLLGHPASGSAFSSRCQGTQRHACHRSRSAMISGVSRPAHGFYNPLPPVPYV